MSHLYEPIIHSAGWLVTATSSSSTYIYIYNTVLYMSLALVMLHVQPPLLARPGIKPVSIQTASQSGRPCLIPSGAPGVPDRRPRARSTTSLATYNIYICLYIYRPCPFMSTTTFHSSRTSDIAEIITSQHKHSRLPWCRHESRRLKQGAKLPMIN